MNKLVRFLLIILVLLTLAALLWWQKPRVTATIKLTTSKISSPESPSAVTAPESVEQPEPMQDLNLSLPKNNFLMNYDVNLPERAQNFRDLFKMEEKESDIKFGGHLILDEKPPDPNAPVWDQVKGAEVGVTIKTP